MKRPSARTAKRRATLLLIATLAIVLTACAGDEGTVDGPVLTSPRPGLLGGGGYMMDAVVGGILVYDESAGCLYLGSEFNGEELRDPVIWPHGATWQADPPAVEIQGHVIEPGMTVRGSGGYLKHEHIENRAGTAVADAAQECVVGQHGDIAFFNPGSDVNVVTDE